MPNEFYPVPLIHIDRFPQTDWFSTCSRFKYRDIFKSLIIINCMHLYMIKYIQINKYFQLIYKVSIYKINESKNWMQYFLTRRYFMSKKRYIDEEYDNFQSSSYMLCIQLYSLIDRLCKRIGKCDWMQQFNWSRNFLAFTENLFFISFSINAF